MFVCSSSPFVPLISFDLRSFSLSLSSFVIICSSCTLNLMYRLSRDIHYDPILLLYLDSHSNNKIQSFLYILRVDTRIRYEETNNTKRWIISSFNLIKFTSTRSLISIRNPRNTCFSHIFYTIYCPKHTNLVNCRLLYMRFY
jgi:hypothetical protein